MTAEHVPFFASCVGWPAELEALEHLVDKGVEITRATFVRHTGFNPRAYFKLPWSHVYWFVNSLIEHVFATEAEIEHVALLAKMSV